MNDELWKQIPQVEKLLQEPTIANWVPKISRPFVLKEIRDVLENIRTQHTQVPLELKYEQIVSQIETACAAVFRQRTARVINCTGVIIHTNLGRSPIEQECWKAAAGINCGYSSLELDLDSGKRGKRSSFVSRLFSQLTGAEASLAVNNNAAALFLVLSTLAPGREVVISRGELVQIGGGFRIPEILELSGAKLIEVGTTNITRVDDYLDHITENTALVLLVHRSNFAIRGFASTPSVRELSTAIGQKVPIVYDQGSGVNTSDIAGEKSIQSLLDQGADLVTCSADKVLSSVQAGFVTGRKDLVKQIAKHPLYRVVRPGKTVVTLLEETLIRRLNGQEGFSLEAYRRTKDEMISLGRRITRGMNRDYVSLVDAPMTLGGGSTPDETLPGEAVKLCLEAPVQDIIEYLRGMEIPIIAAVSGGAVQLHLAAVQDDDVGYIRESLKNLLEKYLSGTNQ